MRLGRAAPCVTFAAGATNDGQDVDAPPPIPPFVSNFGDYPESFKQKYRAHVAKPPKEIILIQLKTFGIIPKLLNEVNYDHRTQTLS